MVAPAMNTFMLQHPTVAENVERLKARGVIVLEPDSGLLACGDEGAGRMPDVPVIVQRARDHFGARDLEGRSILITAGPTREPIDPVRYISNRSSGKMGYALADAARRRGAKVTLVSGPTALPAPAGVELIDVLTAQEMHDVVLEHLSSRRLRPREGCRDKDQEGVGRGVADPRAAQEPRHPPGGRGLIPPPLHRCLRRGDRQRRAARPREAAAQERRPDCRQRRQRPHNRI